MSKRLLFFRSGAIGDLMHCLPLFKLIKSKNPDYKIELITASKQVNELFKNAAPYIDKLWCFKKKFKTTADKTGLLLLDYLKKNKVDEFINLHSSLMKGFYYNFAFVRARKFINYKKEPELSAHDNYIASYYPKLKKTLLNEEAKKDLLEYKCLEIESEQEAQNYICIVPGVGKLRPHRAYPLTLWFKFIKTFILENPDTKIKILGGPDEAALSMEIDRRLGEYKIVENQCQNLIGQTSLLELAQILSGARKVFSCDTGILHIAAALDKPIEAMFSITCEKRFGPFASNTKVITNTQCPCDIAKTNMPKHCTNLYEGYAKCIWELEFSPKLDI